MTFGPSRALVRLGLCFGLSANVIKTAFCYVNQKCIAHTITHTVDTHTHRRVNKVGQKICCILAGASQKINFNLHASLSVGGRVWECGNVCVWGSACVCVCVSLYYVKAITCLTHLHALLAFQCQSRSIFRISLGTKLCRTTFRFSSVLLNIFRKPILVCSLN